MLCKHWIGLVLLMLATLAGAEELLVFGGEGFPPQIYLDNGKPSGIIPRLLERLSADTGDTYQLVLLPWKRAINEATAGRGAITSFSWTPERARLFDFSEPMLDNLLHITILRERAAEFRSIGDLKGKLVGVPLGVSLGVEMDRQINNRVFQVDFDNSPVSRIRKLEAGRIDAALIGAMGVRQTVRQEPELSGIEDKFVTLTFPLEHDWQYLAFAKSMHRQDALQRFNKALTALKKTREYQKIVDDNSAR